MSGGHWDYSGREIRWKLESVAADETVQKRWPMVAGALDVLAQAIDQVEHDMDWDLSSDSRIEDDSAFDRRAFASLFGPLLELAPDAWFPRGKWATIQAIQERVESDADLDT